LARQNKKDSAENKKGDESHRIPTGDEGGRPAIQESAEEEWAGTGRLTSTSSQRQGGRVATSPEPDGRDAVRGPYGGAREDGPADSVLPVLCFVKGSGDWGAVTEAEMLPLLRPHHTRAHQFDGGDYRSIRACTTGRFEPYV